MLRVEARNAQTPIERKPEWIRTTAKMGPEFTQIHSMVKGQGLHTVCQEAGCPNIFECSGRSTPSTPTASTPPPWASPAPRGRVFTPRPRTTSRPFPAFFKRIRPAFTYDKSLRVITMARGRASSPSQPHPRHGRGGHEIEEAIRDLHDAGCDILTITQYLRPSPKHHPIDRWVKPEEFVHWSDVAEDLGFKGVWRAPSSAALPGRPPLGDRDAPVGPADPRTPRPPRGGHGRPRPPGGRVIGGPRGTHRILIPVRGIPRAPTHRSRASTSRVRPAREEVRPHRADPPGVHRHQVARPQPRVVDAPRGRRRRRGRHRHRLRVRRLLALVCRHRRHPDGHPRRRGRHEQAGQHRHVPRSRASPAPPAPP